MYCETEMKPHLKWSEEARKGSSHVIPLFVGLCSPNRKKPTLLTKQEEDFLLVQQQPSQ